MSESDRRDTDSRGRRDADREPHERLIELTEDFVSGVNHRLKKLERQLYARWAFTFLSILVAALLFSRAQHTGSQAALKAQRAANVAQRLGRANRRLTAEIQQQRVDTIRTSCEEQNARHSATIRVLDRVIRQYIAQHPEQAAQVSASRSSNVFLIDALAPSQDCARIVYRATHNGRVPPLIGTPTYPPGLSHLLRGP